MVAARYATIVACCLLGMSTLAAEPMKPLKCQEPLRRDTSHAKLAAKYGLGNTVTEYDGLADADVTILFPNNPERRLKIQWQDQKARRNLGHVTIAGRSAWSVAGVSIGTSLIELERLNGGPFELNRFEGDYPGDITDWLGGRFAAPLTGGCVFGAQVAPDKHTSDAVYKALEKEGPPDRSLLSSGPALRAAKPVVSEIMISFPD